jgi:hypothetical protein
MKRERKGKEEEDGDLLTYRGGQNIFACAGLSFEESGGAT